MLSAHSCPAPLSVAHTAWWSLGGPVQAPRVPALLPTVVSDWGSAASPGPMLLEHAWALDCLTGTGCLEEAVPVALRFCEGQDCLGLGAGAWPVAAAVVQAQRLAVGKWRSWSLPQARLVLHPLGYLWLQRGTPCGASGSGALNPGSAHSGWPSWARPRRPGAVVSFYWREALVNSACLRSGAQRPWGGGRWCSVGGEDPGGL